MACRELELTLLSARDLKNVNLIMRMAVYAVVTISGDPLTQQCTAPDPYGGSNPCWNATLRFTVPPTAALAAGSCLHVLLRAERVLGDRDVGEVIIPLTELLTDVATWGPQPPKLVSYQVRKVHRWEPRGVLNVSYRLGPVVAPVDAPGKTPHSSPDDNPPPPPRPPPRPSAAGHTAEAEHYDGIRPMGPQVWVGQIVLPARTNVSPRKPKQDLQHDNNTQQPIISPRKEDGGTFQVVQPATTLAGAPSTPSPCSSAHSSTRSPYSLAHPSTPSPRSTTTR